MAGLKVVKPVVQLNNPWPYGYRVSHIRSRSRRPAFCLFHITPAARPGAAAGKIILADLAAYTIGTGGRCAATQGEHILGQYDHIYLPGATVDSKQQ